MRLSLLGIFFLLYSVSAFPVLHHVNGISTVLSGDPAAPAGPDKAPASVSFKLKSAPLFDDRTSKIHALPYKKTAKNLHSSCIDKRSVNSVEKAIRDRTTMIGSGVTGIVFKTTFEGMDAVVKVIDTTRPGGAPESVRKEVTDLKTVRQFLGWGEKKTEKGHFLYVVMPNMGVPSGETGLTHAQQLELQDKAIDYYRNTYHIENNDKNSNNYTYREVNGQWQAEIVDWARATYRGTLRPDPGNPQLTDPTECNVM